MHRPTTSTDELLRFAIADKRAVTFILDGCRRIAEPHDYGVIDGVPRLFFYQTGGESRSGPPTGWRWGLLSKISELKVLDSRFAGARPAPSGRHNRWDILIATVSTRPSSVTSVTTSPAARTKTGTARAIGLRDRRTKRAGSRIASKQDKPSQPINNRRTFNRSR